MLGSMLNMFPKQPPQPRPQPNFPMFPVPTVDSGSTFITTEDPNGDIAITTTFEAQTFETTFETMPVETTTFETTYETSTQPGYGNFNLKN
jgi:hypothetical protein